MFDEDLMELEARRDARTNLAAAILAFAVMWLSFVLYFFAGTHAYLGISQVIPALVLGLRFAVLILSAVILIRSIKGLYAKKQPSRNWTAAILCLISFIAVSVSFFKMFLKPLLTAAWK